METSYNEEVIQTEEMKSFIIDKPEQKEEETDND